jgi:hypothetical protein
MSRPTVPTLTRPSTTVAAMSLAAGLAFAASADQTTVVTFDTGLEGWVGIGEIEATGGNPGAHLHTVNPDTFGLTYSNSSGPWADDFSVYDAVTFSTDVLVEDISFFGTPVSRNWLVEIRDFDNVPAGYPWVSVWYVMGAISEGPTYQTYSVTIDDPAATALPPGWGGYGAEDPSTFEPILPADRTFADVLAGADEIVFTTFQPGFFYGFTAFDVRLDNLTLTTVGGGTGDPADVNGDGVVDFDDLISVLAAFGPCPGCPEDIDGNDLVAFDDLLAVLAGWSV